MIWKAVGHPSVGPFGAWCTAAYREVILQVFGRCVDGGLEQKDLNLKLLIDLTSEESQMGLSGHHEVVSAVPH